MKWLAPHPSIMSGDCNRNQNVREILKNAHLYRANSLLSGGSTLLTGGSEGKACWGSSRDLVSDESTCEGSGNTHSSSASVHVFLDTTGACEVDCGAGTVLFRFLSLVRSICFLSLPCRTLSQSNAVSRQCWHCVQEGGGLLTAKSPLLQKYAFNKCTRITTQLMMNHWGMFVSIFQQGCCVNQ